MRCFSGERVLETSDELMQEQCHLTSVCQWLTFLKTLQEAHICGIDGPSTAKERMQYNLWVKAYMVPLKDGGGKEKDSTSVCVHAVHIVSGREGADRSFSTGTAIHARTCNLLRMFGPGPQMEDCP